MAVVGWFLGVLCVCAFDGHSKEIVRCTYADVLDSGPVFEGLVVESYDNCGYIFLVKKTCFDEVFDRHEFFGHGIDWRNC
jgi:hypothetical protein